ncbi:MAG: hypothetical protein OEO79_04470 [Gemmatimonadota bacterium]|nr:hypothetical protein [Gemmatimonadota bacterium]
MSRRVVWGCLVAAIVTVVLPPRVAAQQPAAPPGWEVPRTAYGYPDLQGNWSNATITPIQRPNGQEPTLSAAEVAEIEGRREAVIEEEAQASDPDRVAPPVGGDGSTGAAGGVGGYNYFWIDAGDRVAVVNGEYRSSLITNPPNGRVPPMTPAAVERRRASFAGASRGGQYDNPESRPAAERCIVSFGSNAGPPMLPNYFYNNNYTIVQTPDNVMIMTEMVHDVRVIRLGGRTNPLPSQLRPYFGDSWGHWAGDTLVVETTNISPEQSFQGAPATAEAKVVERFTRAGPNTLNYEFTVIDPTTFVAEWGGTLPYNRQPGQVYEYACHEGNYAMQNVLSGARAQEAREAAQNDQPR